MPASARVTAKTLLRAVRYLTRRDADLAQVVEMHGAPPLWAREQSFATLVHIILEQQVSLASARAAFDRLCEAASPLTPVTFLELHSRKLRAIGFSRQKAAYCRELARALAAGDLDLERLNRFGVERARRELLAIKGIGPWTADIYLLMAQGRPDIWPPGDLALLKAAQRVKRLDTLPDRDQFQELGESWRPWRSVAARFLWHSYLEERRLSGAGKGG